MESSDLHLDSPIVKNMLLARIAENPAYSMRAFARDLGVSHTFLSLYFSGKKNLSPKRAVAFAELLNLDIHQKKILLNSTLQNLEFMPKLRSQRNTFKKSFVLELDTFKYLSDWYHVAIMELSLLPTFKWDPHWISRKLGIRLKQTQEAIKRLKRLGLIKELKNGKWEKKDPSIAIHSPSSNVAIRNYHIEMITKALNHLKNTTQQSFMERDITGCTFPADPSKLEIANKKINRFRKEIIKLLWTENSSQVYQMNIQLFPLTKKSET